MVVMSYFMANSEFSSTLHLPILALPANCSANLSMVGPSWRHGPHHGAQKSTTTGVLLFSTSVAQLALVNSTTFLPAMRSSLSCSGNAAAGSGAPASDHSIISGLVPND